MTGLVDCNNFFVSCERTVHPELEGKAVVVMSNNDGCVIARSNEAKRLGIKMGQPVFQISDLVNSGRIVAVSGHHLLYRDISVRVHEIFHRYAPACIDYSVDEAFLDMRGIPVRYLADIGNHIYDDCMRETRIPVTVGFAATKTLAKLSTETNKKKGVKTGLLVEPDEIRTVLENLEIKELWGIGRKLSKKLYNCGIYTIADFADRPVGWVRQTIGVSGERTWLELHGQPCIELDHVGRALQDSISETRTFPKDISDYDYLRTRIVMYAEHCSAKMRAMHGACKALGVMLCTNRFGDDPYKSLYTELEFAEPQHSLPVIIEAVMAAFHRIYMPGLSYKRGGVFFTEIVADCPRTGSLFADEDEEGAENGNSRETQRLLDTIDRINAGGNGTPIIGFAGGWTGRLPRNNDGYSSSFQFRK